MAVIFTGSDHAGFEMKNLLMEHLVSLGHKVEDCGTHTRESCDYPLFAQKVCQKTLAESGMGLLVCGTGIGMSMAANRLEGIRAALCSTELQARLARQHNNANILCLGARIIGAELALAITTTFFEATFEGGRHQRRIALFDLLSRTQE